MPKVMVEVPEELAEAVRRPVKDMEVGVVEICSGKPLDVAALERRAAAFREALPSRLDFSPRDRF